MHSINFYVWEFLAALGFKRIYQHFPNIHKMRQAVIENSKYFSTLDPRAEIQPLVNAPFKGEWVKIKSGNPKMIVLYLHGGYYIMGEPSNFRSFLTHLCSRLNADILSLDYPLTPEHPFPEPIEEAHKAYRWLLDNGVNPNDLIIAGDSAGGGLAISLIQWIRNKQEPMPASVVAINPWLNLDGDTSDLPELLKHDRFLSAPVAEYAINNYSNGSDRQNPLISPMFADLAEFPPIFIQAGSADPLVAQAIEFEKRAKLQNATVTLDVWEGMPHDWQVIMHSRARESREAIDNICIFINSTTIHLNLNKVYSA